ncbi:HAD family hydrolase [Allosediminivita pacifica]|uniref:Putative hydrolase of the HAD superfamily n=1 Tax=Allosediminivita pacifica TaxID=1267769 RepID=A0A2T6B7I8_9RHOB|nr:HAD-IA family hydrolase [Allosediminivita pacifica]PTX52016.1 putative hydrolase of the HAD superfamily [Allosediminivita pacifica]GGA97877.1 hydrolase [Allosediminivita pacifica]
MAPALIVWDFDGVLNANVVEGRFVWADGLQDDLGVDPAEFSRDLFASGLMGEIIRGRVDLLAHVSDWLAGQGHEVSGEAFLTYWFEKDARPDAEVLGWLQAHPARHVIGTNNESRRSAYIEGPMGYSTRVERVFSSGRMGVAKPDAEFFAQIEDWAGVPSREILLVDDAEANVAAARDRGWQAFHFVLGTRDALPGVLGLA